MNCHPLIRFGHNTKPPPVWLSRSVGLADQSFTCPRRRARLLPVMATSPSTPAVFRPALRSRPPPARLLACCSSPQHEILQPPGLGQVTCLGRPEDPLPSPPYVVLVDWPVDGIPAENLGPPVRSLSGPLSPPPPQGEVVAPGGTPWS